MKIRPAAIHATTFVASLAPTSVALGQDEESSADEAARELANPNTALASLTFKNQFRFFEGDLPNAGDQWSYTMLFQPVLPFPLNNGDKDVSLSEIE